MNVIKSKDLRNREILANILMFCQLNVQNRFQVLIFGVSQSFLEEVPTGCRFAPVDVFLSGNVTKVFLEQIVKVYDINFLFSAEEM